MSGQASIAAGRHPPGLLYLAFTELWERFSYYGMTALLALYMTKQLLLPGHAENVLGLSALRNLFEIRGTLSNVAFASLIFGWYSGLVYFTPILGGLLADRWLGAKRTVMLGALLMASGHLAMTFDQSFLIALLLLVLGSGCLKGNITAQVGALYPEAAASLRDRAYTIFSTAINIGAVIGPLITGALAAAYGWHAGFGAAAALMLVALGVYLAGQRHLPAAKVRHGEPAARAPLDADDRRRMIALLAVVVLVIPASIGFLLGQGIGLVWTDQYVWLQTPFGAFPTAWLISINAFSSILTAPLLIALWAWQARRGREPHGITKMAIGGLIIAASSLVLVAGMWLDGEPGSVSLIWPVLSYFGAGVGFMWYWPVLLALVSAKAPARINATVMGATFMSLFVASVLGGWVGTLYDGMKPAQFWLLIAAISASGALLALLLRAPLRRGLEGGPSGTAQD